MAATLTKIWVKAQDTDGVLERIATIIRKQFRIEEFHFRRTNPKRSEVTIEFAIMIEAEAVERFLKLLKVQPDIIDAYEGLRHIEPDLARLPLLAPWYDQNGQAAASD